VEKDSADQITEAPVVELAPENPEEPPVELACVCPEEKMPMTKEERNFFFKKEPAPAIKAIALT